MTDKELHFEVLKVFNDPWAGFETSRLRDLERISYIEGNLLVSDLLNALADAWDELEEIKE